MKLSGEVEGRGSNCFRLDDCAGRVFDGRPCVRWKSTLCCGIAVLGKRVWMDKGLMLQVRFRCCMYASPYRRQYQAMLWMFLVRDVV